MTKNKNDGKYPIFNESKDTYIECICKTEPFWSSYMLFAFNNREGFKKIEELASLKNQVEETRLQDKLGKQNYHEHAEKLFEPITDTIRNTSENLTKTLRKLIVKTTKR